jgi:hypothetical protein
LTGAGAAGADRVARFIGGALAAAAIASSPEGMDVNRISDRKHLRALFSGRAPIGASAPGAATGKGSQ